MKQSFRSLKRLELVELIYQLRKENLDLRRHCKELEKQLEKSEKLVAAYVVAAHEQLERTDVQKMLADSWDLTLFTCTYGGANRVTVRLTRVDAFAANGALEGDAESGPTQAGALVCRQTGGASR